jgi:RimJ/RimL family protein N-acetyltransferase
VTQYRKYPDALSNYFEQIERGCGKRNSTFTNIDAVSHDLDTNRFLFREFKNSCEPLTKGQRWTLEALAHLPGCTVWIVRLAGPGEIGFEHVTRQRPEEVITIPEYRRRVHGWWFAPALERSARAWDEPIEQGAQR